MENETKTFTEEEVNKKLQSETDKVRTEYSKKIKEMENKIKELTPTEKSPEQLELEERIKKLENKEKEVQAKELELKVSETLESNGLTSQLAKYLNMQGVEDIESYVKEVSEVIGQHINNSKLNGSFKPNKHNSNKTTITKEQFQNMSYTERINLYQNNKELYDLLSK